MRRAHVNSGLIAVVLVCSTLWRPLAGTALGQDAEMTAACGPELHRFCSGTQPGGGRLIQCLDGENANLSAGCRQYVAAARQGCAPEQGRSIECIRPSDTDAAIKQFDRLHYVLVNKATPAAANLLVFLTGTSGKPPGPNAFLHAAADVGYRVISLDYNDEPAVNVYCARRGPTCSARFRDMRIYGDGISIDPAIDNTQAESIVNRLVKLLTYLDRMEPQKNWAAYLDHGAPNWHRIALAGQSQGAGMAAFIAKKERVARVILFSSPWDFFVSGNTRILAPWLAVPAATPPELWFGGYHQRENEASLLAKTYPALRIPPQNIRVFKGDLPPQLRGTKEENPFHGEGLFDPLYAQDRAFFLGRSP